MNKREARKIALSELVGTLRGYQTNKMFRYQEDPSLTEADILKIDTEAAEIIDGLGRRLDRLLATQQAA